MATETLEALAHPTSDKIQKTFDDLESEKTLINACTRHWKALTDHFAALSKTLADRSHSLDVKIRAIDSHTEETLASLHRRESSIPDLESAASDAIESKKQYAVEEMEDPDPPPPSSKSEVLRILCRRMDSGNLWRFMNSHRDELSLLRKEVADAVAESVDACRLVIDAVDDFLKNREGSVESNEGGDRFWSIEMLLRVLFDSEGRRGPDVSEKIRERAAEVAWEWKKRVGVKGEEKEGEEGKEGEGEEGGELGGAEALIFLQIVAAFGLKSKFEEEELRRLVVEHASGEEMAKVAVGLGFGDKIADVITELVKAGKELDAVCFACEAGLTEKFAPAPLLKTYLQNSKEKAYSTLKNGNHSAAANEESTNLQMNSLRSIINCVENYKLESQFSIEGLKKRLSNLEKAKAERKKSAAATKSQNKRGRASAGGSTPSFRPLKSAKNYASYGSSYYNPPPAARNPYARQQYYMPDEMGGSRSAGVPYGGASTGSYSGYDYGASHSGPAPLQYPH